MKTLFSLVAACSLFSSLAADCCPAPKPQPAPCCPPPTQECCPITRPCCPSSYPCCGATYELYGSWLFLQPNGSNIYYAVEAFPFDTSIAVPEVSPNWEVFEINPDYRSGFEVGAKVLFPKSDMNLTLNWERLHTSDSSSMDIALPGNMVGPFFNIGPNSTLYTRAQGRATFHFDTARFLVGKKICFMNDLRTNLYAGAAFARIKQTVFSNFFNQFGATSRSINAPSTFTGAGPQFGVDFDYRLFAQLYFTGNSSVTLLMGQLKNHTTFKSYSPGLSGFGIPQPNVQRTNVPNRTQVIPGFEEKLGFSYLFCFGPCRLTLAAGYQFQIYLDAVQSVDMTAPQVLPPLIAGLTVDMGVYAVGFERTLSNFMLTGPYVSLDLQF